MQPSLAHKVLRFGDPCHQGGASQLPLQAAAKATALRGATPIHPESKARALPSGSLEASVSGQEKLEDAAESAFSFRRGKLRREEKGKGTPKTEKGRRNMGKRLQFGKVVILGVGQIPNCLKFNPFSLLNPISSWSPKCGRSKFSKMKETQNPPKPAGMPRPGAERWR